MRQSGKASMLLWKILKIFGSFGRKEDTGIAVFFVATYGEGDPRTMLSSLTSGSRIRMTSSRREDARLDTACSVSATHSTKSLIPWEKGRSQVG